jgi:D-tyrosyl-tRNA(Tyr) deacylase
MTTPHDDVLFRLVVQRALNAEVLIDGQSQGAMGPGLVVLFGVAAKWNENDSGLRRFDASRDKEIVVGLEKLADKLVGLRIFNDADGKMNLSVKDVRGALYVVSQFTLFADCRKGFRPGFSAAARPPFAAEIYHCFVDILRRKMDSLSVLTGEFGADMKVSLVNDGPVTIVIDANTQG